MGLLGFCKEACDCAFSGGVIYEIINNTSSFAEVLTGKNKFKDSYHGIARIFNAPAS